MLLPIIMGLQERVSIRGAKNKIRRTAATTDPLAMTAPQGRTFEKNEYKKLANRYKVNHSKRDTHMA